MKERSPIRGRSDRRALLRAATSLGRLWQENKRENDGRALVAEICTGFTEGFDTPDLKAARSLLNEL